MSGSQHRQSHRLESEHGTVGAYVIGFVLSLVLTLIPYYLVVNHKLSGTSLLATILGFGVGQMIVQLTFFLHLGRGPKPNWNFFFFMATVGVILVVVGGSIMIIHNLHYNMSPQDQSKRLINDEDIAQIGSKKTGACAGQHTNHQVVIQDGRVTPLHTAATKCDTLTFINNDSRSREIAFGPHEHHEVYSGVDELIVRKGQNGTITLSETGVYEFHDHLNPEVTGEFAVNP